jgi:hypothetical protein
VNSKALLFALAAIALSAGVLLMLSGLEVTSTESLVTVLNYDPPGFPYTLIVLKAGPAREYENIGFLEPGASVTAIARDEAGGWLLLDEPRAWVSVAAGEVTGSIDALPTSAEVFSPDPSPAVTATNPADGQPVERRMGPGEGFEVIGTIEPGATVQVTARSDDDAWLMTDATGWTRADDLDVTGDIDDLPALHIAP